MMKLSRYRKLWLFWGLYWYISHSWTNNRYL